jgi:hypothetical protein
MDQEIARLTRSLNILENAFNSLQQDYKAHKRRVILALEKIRSEVSDLGRAGATVATIVAESPTEDSGASVERPVEQTSVRQPPQGVKPRGAKGKGGSRTKVGGA